MLRYTHWKRSDEKPNMNPREVSWLCRRVRPYTPLLAAMASLILIAAGAAVAQISRSVSDGVYTEEQALELARLLLRENTQRIFQALLRRFGPDLRVEAQPSPLSPSARPQKRAVPELRVVHYIILWSPVHRV